MKRKLVSLVIVGLFAVPLVNAAPSARKAAPSKAHPQPVKKSAVQASGDWHSPPSLAADLGAEVQVDGYTFRLPEGYREIPIPPQFTAQQQSHGFDTHVYTAARRSDGTTAGITVTVATPPPGAGGLPPLSDALQMTIAQKQQVWGNFIESKPESGQIAALPFARAYFKGVYSDAGVTRLAHGIAYVTEDNGKMISLMGEDSEPHSKYSLPIIEAAILTFHKE